MSVPDTLTWVANADPLEVSAYNDALVEAAGHHPASEYAETYWLPLIGPSGLWALRRLVAGLERSPDGFTVPLRALAGEPRSTSRPSRAGGTWCDWRSHR